MACKEKRYYRGWFLKMVFRIRIVAAAAAVVASVAQIEFYYPTIKNS